MIKAVIIDDLPEAVQSLRADLESYCTEIDIIGAAPSVVEGAKILKQLKPDLLFLDIQLEDGTGFDLLEILDGFSFKVIFTTALDSFAIKAFRFSAVDYLLKPIDPDELQEAVTKAKQSISADYEFLLENVKEHKPLERIALHTLEKIQIVRISDIIRCESSGNYTTFFFKDGTKLLVTKTLKEFDKLLSEHLFLRVHQSHLVNGKQIKAFVKTDGGYLQMSDGAQVPVSTRKRAGIIELLEKL